VDHKKPNLIVLIGPTAVGKTSTAIKIAQAINAPILSADSRQFYKELSIGTAKPTLKEQAAAKHHFIDNKSIAEEYNASDFEKEAISFLEMHFKTNSNAILCGGSGMYIDAVCKGFDSEVPSSDDNIRQELQNEFEKNGIKSLQKKLKSLDAVYYGTVDLNNAKRLMRAIEVCLITGKPYSAIRQGKSVVRSFNIVKIGLMMERAHLYERINKRVDLMMEAGLLEEVKSVERYRENNALKTVGYRELFLYLDGKYTLSEAVEKIKVNSRRYAKRQLSWFKKDGEISWFEPNNWEQILDYLHQTNLKSR